MDSPEVLQNRVKEFSSARACVSECLMGKGEGGGRGGELTRRSKE